MVQRYYDDFKSRKFSSHYIRQKKNNHTQEIIKIDYKFVKVRSSVKTQISNAHNFEDDNTLTTIVNNIENLIHQSSVANKWLKDNKMVLNPGKFKALILDQKKNNHTQEIIKIDHKFVKVKSSAKPLGVQILAELNFNSHITNKMYRSAANQLKALVRLRKFIGFEEKKVLNNNQILTIVR